ncbi:MAG: hypothetical protein E7774_01210 [Bradyrhizobium sp.]|nr:MAG: hypothetical protein E7774_01210 [Bradyrhizobium sp.]
MRRLSISGAMALPLLLAGCSGAMLETYDLNAVQPPARHVLRGAFHIPEPTATTDLDSDRILLRAGPERLAVLADAKWPDRLPVILKARLTQSFQNAGLSGEIDARPFVPGERQLALDIRKFELVVSCSCVRIDIAAKVIGGSSGIVAAQDFVAEARVASTAPANVSVAMNGALATVLTRIVAFAAALL